MQQKQRPQEGAVDEGTGTQLHAQVADAASEGLLGVAPEQNLGIFYWAIVDIRTKPLESSEAGILNAVRESPMLVGAARN